MGIFAILYLVSFICFIVGLIKPSVFSKLLGSTVDRKKIGLVFGIPALVTFILFEATTTPDVNAPTQEEKKQQVVAEVKAPTKTEAAMTTPAVAPKELTTLDKLWVALDASIGSRKSYDVSYDATTKTANLTLTDLTIWDENSIVRDGYAALVKFGADAFKIENVEFVTVDVKTEMQNQYGKSSLQDVVTITMPKDEFAKYDWNALQYQPISHQMERSSTQYYIHPGILNKLDPSKLYLAEPAR